jgi:hypothetical protein
MKQVRPVSHQVARFRQKIEMDQSARYSLAVAYCNRLFVYLFFPLKEFFTCIDTSPLLLRAEGLQNLGLCSALSVFEQGGIFIVPHLL